MVYFVSISLYLVRFGMVRKNVSEKGSPDNCISASTTADLTCARRVFIALVHVSQTGRGG